MSKDTKRRDNKGRVLRTGESQRANGSYQYRYTVEGRREYIYAPTLKELRIKEDEIQRRIVLNISTCQSSATLIDAVKNNVASKNNCKRSTIVSYQRIMGILSKHPFMHTKVTDVTRASAKLWLSEMQKLGYKKGTLRDFKLLIRSSLENFVEDRIIAFNPFDIKLSFLMDDQKEREVIPPDQWAIFVSFLEGDKISCKHRDMFVILYETGMRVSELCGLTVDDIDLENRCVYINRQMLVIKETHTLYIDSPKTKAGRRVIPLTAEAIAAFRSAIGTRDPNCASIDGVSGFLFSAKGRPVHRAMIHDYFRGALKRYNAQYPDNPIHCSPHCLRHSFATNISMTGMNPKTSQYLMGHSSVSITLDTYTHTNIDHVLNEFHQLVESKN